MIVWPMEIWILNKKRLIKRRWSTQAPSNYAGEIWKRRFHSEKHQLFSVHTVSKKFENATITVILDLCLRKTRGISRDHRDVIVFFKKIPLSKFFPFTRKWEAGVFELLRSEERFLQNLRFTEGLVWTVGITVEIKLRFQTSQANCGREALKNWIGNCSHTEKKYSGWKTPLPLVMFHKANTLCLATTSSNLKSFLGE